MSGSMDNAGAAGAQTWPLTTATAVMAVPLPADAKASPHPSPLPQAGEGALSPATRHTGEGALPSAAPQARESGALPPLPLAGEGWGEGKPEAGETQAVATPPNKPSVPTATTGQTAPPASFGEPTGAAGAVGGTVLALLLVVGVILALAWMAKRMPGLGAVGGGNPALKIVGSLALGPRERVVVVAVGDTQLLLATGPNGTRTLHTLDQPLPMPANAPSPFAQVLARQFGKKPS